jgi:hypothetical protein
LPRDITDPDAGSFEFTRGAGEFPGWRGVRTHGGPTAPPTNQPWVAVNLIASGGELGVRPGWADFGATGLSTPFVSGIGDLDCNQRRLWSVLNACPGASGGTIMTYDFDQEPEFQSVAKFFGLAGNGLVLSPYGTDVVVGEGSNFRAFMDRRARWGEALAQTGDMGHRTLHRFATGEEILSIGEAFGYVFLGVGTKAAGSIYQWDGVSMVEDLTSIGGAVGIGSYREDMVAVFQDAGANYIKIRDAGGTWSTKVPAAGTLLAKNWPRQMVSYRDVLYIIDTSTGIWSYDGTTLQSAHTIAGATMRAIDVFNDKLFVAYDTGTNARIAEYDAETTTWTDVRKDLTTQFTNTYRVHGMANYRGALWCGMGGGFRYLTASGLYYYTAYLVVSPGKDVGNATWLGTGPSAYSAPADATGPALAMVL